jgi:hypothetical protein
MIERRYEQSVLAHVIDDTDGHGGNKIEGASSQLVGCI